MLKVGNDQEMVQSERYSHSKNRGGGKTKRSGTYTEKTYRKPSEQLLPIRLALNYPILIKQM